MSDAFPTFRLAWRSTVGRFLTLPPLRRWAWALLVAGAACALYFGVLYDTSTSVPGETYRRVHNIGLQQNRQLGFVGGVAVGLAGGAMLIYDRHHRRKTPDSATTR